MSVRYRRKIDEQIRNGRSGGTDKMGYCILLPKIFMFTACAFFLTCGIFLMTTNIWMVANPYDFVVNFGQIGYNATEEKSLKYDFDQPSVYVMAFLGLVLVVLALMGAFATVFERPYILFSFSMLIVVILLMQIGLGIFMIMYDDKVDESINNWFVSCLKGGYENRDERNVDSFLWDEVFIKYKCCGVNNVSDFSFNSTSENWVPKSCCYHSDKKLDCLRDDYKDLKGCFDVFADVLDANRDLIVGVIFAASALEIFTIASGFFLVRVSTFSVKYPRT